MSVHYTPITATGLVYTGATELYGITLTASASAAATLALYDWSDATGTVLHKVGAVTSTTASVQFDEPISVKRYIYAVIGGTGASATILVSGDFTTTSTTTSTSTTTTSTSSSTTAT